MNSIPILIVSRLHTLFFMFNYTPSISIDFKSVLPMLISFYSSRCNSGGKRASSKLKFAWKLFDWIFTRRCRWFTCSDKNYGSLISFLGTSIFASKHRSRWVCAIGFKFLLNFFLFIYEWKFHGLRLLSNGHTCKQFTLKNFFAVFRTIPRDKNANKKRFLSDVLQFSVNYRDGFSFQTIADISPSLQFHPLLLEFHHSSVFFLSHLLSCIIEFANIVQNFFCLKFLAQEKRRAKDEVSYVLNFNGF